MVVSTARYVSCPFCYEGDFDLIGLKRHLMLWCEEYEKTPNDDPVKEDDKPRLDV